MRRLGARPASSASSSLETAGFWADGAPLCQSAPAPTSTAAKPTQGATKVTRLDFRILELYGRAANFAGPQDHLKVSRP